jgi:serine/threonine protein kinase
MVEIALALCFAHSFGLLHGHLKASNILSDAHHQVQVETGGFEANCGVRKPTFPRLHFISLKS